MEIFVARQPIFDRKMNVFAYELLYRRQNANYYDSANGDEATASVICNSFLSIGIDNLTGGKKGFINFTENLLKDGTASLLPKDKIYIEILENIYPSEDVIKACIKLKKEGYTLILDDFILKPEFVPFLDVTDIIKVDFKVSDRIERRGIIDLVNSKHIKFVAEKIETQEELKEALDIGYDYFQGYFFSKPVMISAEDVPPVKLNGLRLLSKLNEPDIDFDEIEKIIETDVSLSYKLLRFINSANFGFKAEIHSIRHALVILGRQEIIKWFSLIILKGLSTDSPDELMVNSVIRAKFAEAIACSIGLRDRASETFLMGLFSNINVLMHRPLKELLTNIALAEDIKAALLGTSNVFGHIYRFILAYEQGDWHKVSHYASLISLNNTNISDLYIASLKWSNNFLGTALTA